MKKKLLIGLLTLSASASLLAGPKTKGPAQQEPTEAQQKHLETYGYIVGKQATAMLGLNAAELKYVDRGFKKGAIGAESPVPLDTPGEEMQKYLQAKAMAFQEVHKQELEAQGIANRKKSAPFFAKLDKNPKVKKTQSGLYYEIVKPGSDLKATETSTVTVDYEGALIDGKIFDSSKKRGEPATFNLGQVIPGFREGLQYVGKGGSIKLYIPADLGYQDQDNPVIPAGSTLVFEVDMIDITETKAPATS